MDTSKAKIGTTPYFLSGKIGFENPSDCLSIYTCAVIPDGKDSKRAVTNRAIITKSADFLSSPHQHQLWQ